MPSTFTSNSAGNPHSEPTAAKRLPIKTIFTRLRSLSVSSSSKHTSTTVLVSAGTVTSTTTASISGLTATTTLRNNDDVLRSIVGGTSTNGNLPAQEGISNMLSVDKTANNNTTFAQCFILEAPLANYFDFQLSTDEKFTTNSIATPDVNCDHPADIFEKQIIDPSFPDFLNTKYVIYQGFGGWISKRRLKTNNVSGSKNAKSSVFIIKTFKYDVLSSTDNSGIFKYKKNCVREFQIMNNLKNRHITPVYNLCKDDDHQSNTIYYSIILPFYQNGDLLAILSNLEKIRKNDNNDLISTKLVNYFFKQIISGVSYLHKSNVVHCDLKLDNFLIDDNFNLKITDFGMAVNLEDFNRNVKKGLDEINVNNVHGDNKDKENKISEIVRSSKNANEVTIEDNDNESVHSTIENSTIYKDINLFKIGTKSYKAPELFFSEKHTRALSDFYSKTCSDEVGKNNDDVIKIMDNIFSNLKSLDSWSIGICYLILNLQMFKPWDFSNVSEDLNFKIFKMFYSSIDKKFLRILKANNLSNSSSNDSNSKKNLENFLNLEISNFINDHKKDENAVGDDERFYESDIRNSITFIKLIPDDLKATIWKLLNFKNDQRLLPEKILAPKDKNGNANSNGKKDYIAEFGWIQNVDFFSNEEIEQMLGL